MRHDATYFKKMEEEKARFKQVSKVYYIDNPSDREIIKNFEEEFLFWLKGNPEYKDNPLSSLKWYEVKGAIKIWKNDLTNYSIANIPLYADLTNKWSALQSLRIRRKKARDYGQKSLEETE